jgi:hypothetical protein
MKRRQVISSGADGKRSFVMRAKVRFVSGKAAASEAG